jgi:hypothetical protein
MDLLLALALRIHYIILELLWFSLVFSSGFTRYIRNMTSFEISLHSSLEESQTHWEARTIILKFVNSPLPHYASQEYS